MSPEALQLALFILEEAIKNEPAIEQEVKSFFTKSNPTPQEWAALRARVNAKSYKDFVPQTALAEAPALAAATPAAPAVPLAPPAQAPAPAPQPFQVETPQDASE